MPPVLPFLGAIGAGIGGAIATVTGSIALGVVGSVIAGAAIVGVTALSVVQAVVGASRKATQNALSRLNLTFDPDAPRKLWFGETAGNTDLLYQEAAGGNQEFITMVIATAAHRIDSYTSLYIEDKLAWTSAGGVQGEYVGYLSVTPVTVGVSGAGMVINSGTIWGANSSLTGCAYIVLRIRRTGLDKKAESPLAAGLPGRLTVIGKGARVYDPRRDTTAGGSGSHRANDESTWQYADGGTVLGTNPALQVLSYMLGYRIGGVVSVGMGVDPARINMADFIAAANVCDEDVALAGGGTQKRYAAAGVFTDSDDHKAALDALCASMNAKLRDTGGRIGIRMEIDDTAGTLLEFTEEDILGPHEWRPNAPLNESYNVVRGRYVDPSPASLYQMTPYGARSVASPDGINRTLTLELPLIDDQFRAQRVAQQVLNKLQYQGTFRADFGPRAWACEEGQPVRLTFGPCGFTSKLFRVVRQELKIINNDEDAQTLCPMTLQEIDPAIYTWTTGDENAQPVAVAAVSYLPTNQPFLITQGQDIGVENDATRGDNLMPNWDMATGTEGYVNGAAVWQRVAAPGDWPVDWVWQNIQTSSPVGSALVFPRVDVRNYRSLYQGLLVERDGGIDGIKIALVGYNAADAAIGEVGGSLASGVLPSTTGSPVLIETGGAVDPAVVYVRIWVFDLAGAAVGSVRVGAGRVAAAQQGADVTSANAPRIEGPGPQDFLFNFTGDTALAGQLPRTLLLRRFRGPVDVTASSSWTLSAVGCTAAVIDEGEIEITAVASSGSLTVTATRDGVPVTFTVPIRKINASPSSSSGSRTASGDVSFTTSSTSFVQAVATEVTTTASGTSVTASASLKVFGSAGYVSTEATWEIFVSGSWSEISPGEVASDQVSIPEFGIDFGTIGISRTRSGLANNTAYPLRLMVRRAAGSGDQSFSGSFAAEAT